MDMRRYAREYCRRGLKPFPLHHVRDDGRCSCGIPECPSPGKHPRTRKGVLDAVHADLARVDAWWGTWPGANIGCATGPASGIYVVDLDGAEGVAEWWALCLLHGDAETREAQTGGGGRHLLFRYPPGGKLGNTAKRLGPHIDTRGDGGYILLAPSNHVSGRRYEWLNERPLADLPEWVGEAMLVERSTPVQRRLPTVFSAAEDDDVAMRILADECAVVAGTGEGARNATLFARACNVAELAWGGELTVATAWAAMRDAGVRSGLTLAEVEQTIGNAFERGRDNPRRVRTRQEGLV